MLFLEDRRVLYNDFAWEEPGHCVESVLEIRRYLTEELGTLTPASELAPHLKAIRSACRKFLDAMQHQRGGRAIRLHYHGNDSFAFYSALGEFRGAIRAARGGNRRTVRHRCRGRAVKGSSGR
jgi:hypothetical protein